MNICPRPGLPVRTLSTSPSRVSPQEIDLQDPEEMLPVKFQRVGIKYPVDISAAVHMPVHVNIV